MNKVAWLTIDSLADGYGVAVIQSISNCSASLVCSGDS